VTPAVVTMECQRGVVGDLSAMAELAAAARPAMANISRLCAEARARGFPVVHATFAFRPDGEGFADNCPLAHHARRMNLDRLAEGMPGVEVVAELGRADTDLESRRHHGFTPFTGTDLDDLLRDRGVEVVVATGVSLNVGVLGLVLSAVDLGYRVIVPSDAVVALPPDYGGAVLRHTIAGLAEVVDTETLVARWRSGGDGSEVDKP
jgi:nicotinamidase-related amidase